MFCIYTGTLSILTAEPMKVVGIVTLIKISACLYFMNKAILLCHYNTFSYLGKFYIYIFKLYILLIYLLKKYFLSLFWLCWIFVAARRLSLLGEWGLLFVLVLRLLIVVASLVPERGL